MDERDLQDRLTRLAERTAPPPRQELADVVVARHRSRRRHALVTTGLVGAVVALVVAATTLLPEDPAAQPASSADAPATAEAFTGPTRGSLAMDAAFVEGVRALDWSPDGANSGDVPDAPPATRRVVFAGDVGGARLALVAGENTARPQGAAADPELQTDLGALSEVATAWFLGPAGATPDQMLLQSVPRGVDPYGGPAAIFDAPTGALVVVGEPGDAMSLSLRPEVSADGSVDRVYAPLDAPDGVGTVVIPNGTSSGQALRYRVVRGDESWTMNPDGSSSGSLRSDVVPDRLRPAPPASPADVLVQHDTAAVLDRLGLTEGQVDLTVVWAGDVPAPAASRTARATLLAATVPSGAVYLESSLAVVTGDGVGGTTCGSGVLAAGAPLAERTFALRCDATDMSADTAVTSSLVVLAPPGTASARALDLDGEVLASFPLTDGVAVAPFPERAATIETRATDGTVLQTTRPLTSADLGD